MGIKSTAAQTANVKSGGTSVLAAAILIWIILCIQESKCKAKEVEERKKQAKSRLGALVVSMLLAIVGIILLAIGSTGDDGDSYGAGDAYVSDSDTTTPQYGKSVCESFGSAMRSCGVSIETTFTGYVGQVVSLMGNSIAVTRYAFPTSPQWRLQNIPQTTGLHYILDPKTQQYLSIKADGTFYMSSEANAMKWKLIANPDTAKKQSFAFQYAAGPFESQFVRKYIDFKTDATANIALLPRVFYWKLTLFP